MKPIQFTHIWLIALSVWSLAADAQTCVDTILPTTAHFVDNRDGTVSDSKTGLMWKQCAEGHSGADCASVDDWTKVTLTWQQALQQVQAVNTGGGFAGYDDWRLPNIKELETVIERQCYDPAINLVLFPGFSGNGNGSGTIEFWSSTMTYRNTVWSVDFGFWASVRQSMFKDFHLHVLLVRSIEPG